MGFLRRFIFWKKVNLDSTSQESSFEELVERFTAASKPRIYGSRERVDAVYKYPPHATKIRTEYYDPEHGTE